MGYAVNMIVSDVTEGTDGEVVIAVYDAVPHGGWMLYFKDIKHATLTSKFYRVRKAASELLSDAAAYLDAIAHDQDWNLGVHVVGYRGDHLGVVDLYQRLNLASKPSREVDNDILDYLFQSAPQKKLRLDESASAVQKRKNQPLFEAAVPGKVIVTADGSFTGAGWNGVTESAGGTGWVIGHHEHQGNPRVILGSATYSSEDYARGGGSNHMEMLALRDAMAAVMDDESVRLHATEIVFFSDSDYSITAIRGCKPNAESFEALKFILTSAQELSRAGIKVDFRWTKGHSENVWNAIAHSMAEMGRRNIEPSSDHHENVLKRLLENHLI